MAFPVGFPDLLIITDIGKVMFIETKIAPRKPTPKQIEFQNELKKRGFIAETVYSLAEFTKLVNF